MKRIIESFDKFQALLHNQNYHLDHIDEERISITGIAKINMVVTILLISLGAIIIIFGIVSFTLDQPEILAGLVFFLVGILLIIFPYYNYYSRKRFRIDLDKSQKTIEFSPATFLRNKQKYSFDEVLNLYLKQKKVNVFVDDTSKSSYANYYSMGLNLSNGKDPALLHFSCQTEELECLVSEFSEVISHFIGVKKKDIEK